MQNIISSFPIQSRKQRKKIFFYQKKLVKKYEDLLTTNVKISKEDRINIFREMNKDFFKFYKENLHLCYWEPQRPLFFAFSLGLLYLQNIDILEEIENIMDFSRNHCKIKDIITLVNDSVKKTIIGSVWVTESNFIYWKLIEFDYQYRKIQNKINIIWNLFQKYKCRKNTCKIISSIKPLKQIFPQEIIRLILSFSDYNNLIWETYRKYKDDIELMIDYCSFDRNKIEDLILRFIHNKYDVVNTILTLDA